MIVQSGLRVCTVLILLINFTVYCDIIPECDGIESQSFIADPTDCESYIYCEEEESFVSKCDDGQRFNGELGICDIAENVECFDFGESSSSSSSSLSTSRTSSTKSTQKSTSTIVPLSSTTTTARTTTTTTTSTTSTTDLISSTTQSTDLVVCPIPSKPDEISYLPNSESCSEYYMCYDRKPIPMTCPRDLEFNKLTLSCDWAASANCKIIGTTTPSPRELCTGKNSGYFEYVKNCHYYYRCLNGLLTIQECPSGFGWDAIKKMCSSNACRRIL